MQRQVWFPHHHHHPNPSVTPPPTTHRTEHAPRLQQFHTAPPCHNQLALPVLSTESPSTVHGSHPAHGLVTVTCCRPLCACPEISLEPADSVSAADSRKCPSGETINRGPPWVCIRMQKDYIRTVELVSCLPCQNSVDLCRKHRNNRVCASGLDERCVVSTE